MSPITYSGASCSSAARRQRGSRPGLEVGGDLLDHHRMLGDREGVVADGLAVPARDAGQAVGDVLDLDVERARGRAGRAGGRTASAARRAARRHLRRRRSPLATGSFLPAGPAAPGCHADRSLDKDQCAGPHCEGASSASGGLEMNWAQDHGAAVGRRGRRGTSSRRRPRWPSRSRPNWLRPRAGRRRRPDPLDGRRLHGRRAGQRRARAIREAAAEGAKAAARGRRRAALRHARASAPWPRRSGRRWRMQGRLSDVVVFDDAAAKGRARWPRRSSRSSPTNSARRWWRARASRSAAWSPWPGTAARRPAAPCARPCRCCRRPRKVVILAAPAASARSSIRPAAGLPRGARRRSPRSRPSDGAATRRRPC